MDEQGSGGKGFLNCLGIGCATLIGLGILVPSLMMGGTGGFGSVIPLLVVGVVIFLIVKSRRKSDQPTYGSVPSTPTQTVSARTSSATYVAAGETDVRRKSLIERRTALLAQIAHLREELNSIEAELQTGKSGSAVTSSSVAASNTVAAPKPKVVKQRKQVALSLQQWLIMGASGLVVVAGSIFVSANLNKLTSLQFLLITLGIALVSGFMAFWSRKISVLLANFMATFSSAMQIASLLIIGDMNFAFAWNTAPAWWWSITLLITTALGYVLTRFSGNFGWKAITLTGFTATALTFGFGVVLDKIAHPEHAFGWFTSVLTLAALALVFLSRHVRAMESHQPIDKADVAYEKDLAARESAAMQRYTTFSSGLLALTGFGNFVYSVVQTLNVPFDALSTSLLTLVWLAAALTQPLWIGQFTQTKAVIIRFDRAIRSIAYVMVALSASAWLHLSDDQTVRAVGTAALAFAVVLVGQFVKRIQRNELAVRVAHYMILVSWLTWNLSTLISAGSSQNLLLGSVFIAFGLSMLLRHWFAFDLIASSSAVVSHLIGLALVTNWLRVSANLTVASIGYAFAALVLILLVVIYSAALGVIASRAKQQVNLLQHWLVLAASIILALLLVIPDGSYKTVSDAVNLLVVMLTVAFVPQAIALLGAKRVTEYRDVLLGYGFAFQAFALYQLLTDKVYIPSASMSFFATVVLAMALINYLLGAVAGHKISVGSAHALANVALLLVIFDDAGVANLPARLGLALILGVAINLVSAWSFTNRVGLGSGLTRNIVLGSMLVTSIAALSNVVERWQGVESADAWLVVLEVLVIATLSALLAERKAFAGTSHELALRVNALIYASIGFIATPALVSASDTDQTQLMLIVSSLVFGAIVLRQLRRSIKVLALGTSYGWFAASYLAPVVAAYLASDFMIRHAVTGDLASFFDHGQTPELHSIPIALAIMIPSLFAKELINARIRVLFADVPVLVPVLWSLIYSVTPTPEHTASLIRQCLTLAVLTALAFLRTRQHKSLGWAVVHYLALAGFAMSVVGLIYDRTSIDWQGPELYSIAVAATVVFGNRVLAKVVELKTTLLTWGLPLAILILPAISFSYSALGLKFEEMSGEQVTRIVATLVASAIALILGIRNGNLGATVVGNIGLALIVIPTVWERAGDVDVESTISLRGLLVGVVTFWLFALGRRFKLISDRSLVYIGLPSAIALSPSIYLAMAALGHPTLTSVDWWRFGIVVSASLVMLILGALRELAGMFFPGLIGVLVSVLPYAFKPMASESWFLWVLLLLIAGIMVWIAVRIDQMRKVGKNSVNWMKSLR